MERIKRAFGVSRREAVRAIAGAAGLGLASGAHAARRTDVDWPTLRGKVRGEVVLKGNARYESVRTGLLWNGRKVERRPEAIVQAACVEDVQEAVRFAGRRGLKVAVRGGGHSWCGSSMRDGGVLIDLGRFRELRIDAEARLASAQPAVTNGELAEALTPLRLAFPIGHCPSVPLSGYILNGGFGWNSGSWGPACANLVEMELVDAHGELVRASETENADLFWAARGAGPGFFGIAVRYHLRLHPLPRGIFTAVSMYPLAASRQIGQWLASLAPNLRREVEVACMVMSAPPDLPPEIAGPHGRVIAIFATAFASGREEAEQWLAAIEAGPGNVPRWRVPLEETPFAALLAAHGAMFPQGRRFGADVFWCNTGPADVLGRLRACVESAPSPESFGMLVLVPPPPPGMDPMAMALSMASPVFAGVIGVWQSPGDDAANQAWVRAGTERLMPVTVGHYVGETDLTAHRDRARRSFAEANWERLMALKAKHDPAGVFHTFLGPA